MARAYQEAGAAAVSVLTDQDFFQGSLDHLRDIKRSVPLPALNKEFMVDELQFYEARAYGADAVLLIVAALERTQLVDFHALARELDLDVLIETHHERELDTVLEWIPDARMIGINNRDLTTFTTDLTITKRLAPRIPPGKLIVSESGIHTRSHVEQLLDIGIHAMLVGESLIKAENSVPKFKNCAGFPPPPRPSAMRREIKVKVCGITNAEDALAAIEAGADALASSSTRKVLAIVVPAVAANIIAGLPPWSHQSACS
jgi:indole-3-glycerol phosphate synthase